MDNPYLQGTSNFQFFLFIIKDSPFPKLFHWNCITILKFVNLKCTHETYDCLHSPILFQLSKYHYQRGGTHKIQPVFFRMTHIIVMSLDANLKRKMSVLTTKLLVDLLLKYCKWYPTQKIDEKEQCLPQDQAFGIGKELEICIFMTTVSLLLQGSDCQSLLWGKQWRSAL